MRAVATVGGAVVHGDPRQDLPPVLLALDARVALTGPTGHREIALSDLYQGFMQTAVGDDEIVTDILVPRDPERRTTYARFTPGSDDDYPTVSVAVAVSMAAGGVVRHGRIALGSAGPTALLARRAASMLYEQVLTPELIAAVADTAAAESSPHTDQRGSAEYRRAMVTVLTRRALDACRAPAA